MRPFAICYYFCRWLLYLYLSLLEFKFKTGWNFSWRIRLTRVFGSPSCCRSHSLYLNKVGTGMESICRTAFAGYNGLGNRRAQTNLLVARKRLATPNPLIVGMRGGPS